MRRLVLAVFEVLLYVQILAATATGFRWARELVPHIPWLDTIPEGTVPVVGGISGFLVGVLISGYGIALLSINGELRRLNRS